MLCEFSLPSQPEKKIRLKEATVSDAIDFSGIDPDCEEQATTVFLERVQERDTYSDPRLGREKIGDSRSLPTLCIQPGIVVSR